MKETIVLSTCTSKYNKIYVVKLNLESGQPEVICELNLTKKLNPNDSNAPVVHSILRSYPSVKKKCDLILATYNNLIMILRHDKKSIKLCHKFEPNHETEIIDFWLSKKSIFSIASGMGELGSINVPTNLVEHVAKMKVKKSKNDPKKEEESESEPDKEEDESEEEDVPELKMNPPYERIKLNCKDLQSCAIDSQGNFLLIGTSAFSGDIKNPSKVAQIGKGLPRSIIQIQKLSNGNYLAHETKTNDLIVYDTLMKIVLRVKGEPFAKNTLGQVVNQLNLTNFSED